MIHVARHMVIPDIFSVRVRAPASAAAVVPWWLSGGIVAANCLVAYTPKGAADLAASYDNNAAPGNGLADCTYDAYQADPGRTPNWAAGTGWGFVHTPYDRFLYTDIVIGLSRTYSLLIRYSGATTAGDHMLGMTIQLAGGNPRFGLGWEGGTPATRLYGNGGTLSVDDATTSGVMGLAGTTGYFDGVAVTGTIGTVAGDIATTWTIGTRNRSDTITDQYLIGDIQAVALYGTVLSAAQVLAVSDAMAAL
jgi:hypothetical protein